MTKEMLEISPVYRAAVEECAAVLRPYGVDLMAEFASTNGFSDPTLAAVGLTAVQVGRAHRSLAIKDNSSHEAAPAASQPCKPSQPLPPKHLCVVNKATACHV